MLASPARAFLSPYLPYIFFPRLSHSTLIVHCHLPPGGAGGKGTWGKIGEDYADGGILDTNDPNYDSDNMVRL